MRAKWALWAGSAFWSCSALSGLIASLKFLIPDLFYGFNWLSWPRIRPVHVQGMIFGWALPVFMCLFYYMIPRLTGTKLWSEKLGIATTFVWSTGVVLMVIGVLNPMDTLNPWWITKGKEYEEWPIVSSIFIVDRLADAHRQYLEHVPAPQIHADVCRPVVCDGVHHVDVVCVCDRQLALAASALQRRLWA